MSPTYVSVAVPVPLHTLFTYAIPAGGTPQPGVRVRVSFGPRRLVGVVVAGPLDAPPDDFDPKRIKPYLEQLDPQPVLDAGLRRLCAWMATYYRLPPGEAWLLPLPPAMTGGRRGTPRKHAFKTVTVARALKQPGPDERLGASMAKALQWLTTVPQATSAEVREATGAELNSLKRLAERGLVSLTDERVSRDALAQVRAISHPAPQPTPAQSLAVAEITAALGDYAAFLLMGVTGSGKTEVYLKVIKHVLDQGGGALVLVPEIALTPQLVARFRARLGDRIAVLHSGLDPRARHEQWVRIAQGELPVVIGARSALFAPLPRLDVIVVDEEHDPSFKQDTAPRYHGRDLALVRAPIARCPVVLGTATPSVASWSNVARGKLTLIELRDRVLDRPMPHVGLVDLRTAELVDSDRVFSRELLEAIADNVTRGEQTILFLNRRGFAAFILCRACGESLSCPSCSVTLTWHRRRSRLVCHWCDHAAPLPPVCPKCADDALEEVGFGTERVEALLKEVLPDARIARMDRDTTRGKSLTNLLDRFRDHEIDILVGTQMVAKGHDFPGVTLVGVLLAEMGLSMPDFRAAERTFQLLTQIAGRAGRAERPGRVLVQTYVPEHYALTHAVTHDARAFLDEELAFREARGWPPSTHLALFRLAAPDAMMVEAEADRLARHLRATATALGAEVRVVGPQPAPIERVRGRWRWQILCSSPTRAPLGAVTQDAMARLDAAKLPAALQISLDVDPHTFL